MREQENAHMAIRLIAGGAASPLARLVDDYLISCSARGLAPRSIQQYQFSLSVLLDWCDTGGVRSLADLDQRAVDRFTASLLARRGSDGRPLSKHTVHTYIRPVRLLLTWAAREGEQVRAKPQLPRREKPLRDVLSRAELATLEHAAGGERDRVIVRVFADCGLRLEELTRLRSGDVIRSGRQAYLRVRGKRARIRDVPVPPQLLRRLDRLIEDRPEDRVGDEIFLTARRGASGQYEALTVGGVYQVVKDAASRAGIAKRVYPHVLRHSWMTEMLRCNMNPVQLAFIAGASQEVIAQHYAHLTKDDAYAAMVSALSHDAHAGRAR